jgi:hypothetical protein
MVSFPCPTTCKTCTESVRLDWWLAIATLLNTVQSGIIFHLVNLGLGASQDGVPLSQLERLGKVRRFFESCTRAGSWISSKHSRQEATFDDPNRKVSQPRSSTSS